MTGNSPSSAQIELAKALAYQTGKRLPRGYTARRDICAGFLDENKAFIRPTERQLNLAVFIAGLRKLKMSRNDFMDYSFCKRFLDCFAGVEGDSMRGIRRADIIVSYMREDKEFEHLQFKLDMDAEDVSFMRHVLVTFGHNGQLVRWDDAIKQEEPFPELTQDAANSLDEETPAFSSDTGITLTQLADLSEEERAAYLVL